VAEPASPGPSIRTGLDPGRLGERECIKMSYKSSFDLSEALDAVDYLADRGAFHRKDKRTGEWRLSPATVAHVKRKLERSWWARKEARKASRERTKKGVGGITDPAAPAASEPFFEPAPEVSR
jgi:hypothetical protein